MWFNRLVKGALFGALFTTPCYMVSGFVVAYITYPRDMSMPDQDSKALLTAILLTVVGFWYGAFAGAFSGGLVALAKMKAVAGFIFTLFLGIAVFSAIFVLSGRTFDGILYYLSATMVLAASLGAALAAYKAGQTPAPSRIPAMAQASE